MTLNCSRRLRVIWTLWGALACIVICLSSAFPSIASAEDSSDIESLEVIADQMYEVVASAGDGYASLNDRTNLKRGLVIVIESNADEVLNKLLRLPEAKRRLVRRIHLGDPTQSIAAAKSLAGFPELESLSVDGNRGAWKGEWCEHLIGLPIKSLRLQALDLTVGLVSIGKIESLEVLYLDGNAFPAGSPESLKRLRNLRQLDLSGSPLEDGDLTVVEEFTELVSLGLSDTLISNRGLVHLEQCKKLKYLSLVGTRVTATGITELKKHLDGVIASFGKR